MLSLSFGLVGVMIIELSHVFDGGFTGAGLNMVDARGEIAQKNRLVFAGLFGGRLVWVMDLLRIKILFDGFLDVFDGRRSQLVSGRGSLIS